MVELKLVPKPEGFDLRDRRSDKKCDASLWTPHDALYDAQQNLVKSGEECDALVVFFRVRLSSGRWVVKRRVSGNGDAVRITALRGIGDLMQWSED